MRSMHKALLLHTKNDYLREKHSCNCLSYELTFLMEHHFQLKGQMTNYIIRTGVFGRHFPTNDQSDLLILRKINNFRLFVCQFGLSRKHQNFRKLIFTSHHDLHRVSKLKAYSDEFETTKINKCDFFKKCHIIKCVHVRMICNDQCVMLQNHTQRKVAI